MAKSSMKNIWLDGKMQDERLRKLTAGKKTAGAATTAEAGAESAAEPKPEDKQ